MEGASGMILETDDPKVVIKRVYNKARGARRTKSYRAPDQQRLQSWAHEVATPAHGFKVLFVPRAWDPEPRQYKMDRINVSKPIDVPDIHSIAGLADDLKRLYEVGWNSKIYPQDYELYLQPDGHVAMVDFDKFGVWKHDGSVEFPWGLRWTADQVKELTPISLNIL